MALIEARPYRPFKSSDEYLEAMREDLAEWLQTMYPALKINAVNFMDRLDTGVALCQHANRVRQAAEDYLMRRQARNKSMTRSMTSGLAGPILALGNVHYLPAARSGTFFARDNVSNFITWCRKSLKIIECLLFETDDLILRKNEKHVILCLLEVARRGAKFGMLAPMLVRMERQIDREIAAENKANGIGIATIYETLTCSNGAESGAQSDGGNGVGTDAVATATDIFESDSDNENDKDDAPMLVYGPKPQIVTNDLKSLHEMVRDLVEKCTCPSQFPMVRVSEGKYRIGDTKVLIFVRILRSHVMVRVGGGWDTLSHFLDKHDPCRCKAQHRFSVAARLIPRNSSQSNGIELHKAQVIFDRSPPTARRVMLASNNQTTPNSNGSPSSSATGNGAATTPTPSSYTKGGKERSRSPTPRCKFANQTIGGEANDKLDTLKTGGQNASALLTSPNVTRRSMSPSPRRLIDMRKKQTSIDSGPKSLLLVSNSDLTACNHENISTPNAANGPIMINSNAEGTANISNKFDNISDNGSEISDEGYRSLGVIQSNAQKRESLHSQASIEDAENNVRLSSDSQWSPADDSNVIKLPEILDTEYTQTHTPYEHLDDAGPQSLPAVLSLPQSYDDDYNNSSSKNAANLNTFEQSGIFITDDEITVDCTSNNPTASLNVTTAATSDTTNKKPTKAATAGSAAQKSTSKIPRSPIAQRRRRSSIDNVTCASGSLQDLSTRTGLPVFSRKKPVYRSVRMPTLTSASRHQYSHSQGNSSDHAHSQTSAVRDVTSTWSGRMAVAPTLTAKKRAAINTTADATAAVPESASSGKTRPFQILYDSNGRRVRGCTTSLTTSPVKNQAASPLAQQLLEAANSSKNDTQILEKMKALLTRYAEINQPCKDASRNMATATAMNTAAVAATPITTAASSATETTANNRNSSKSGQFDDFTTAWVHSNGNLERSNSCSPPTKTLSKRSSAASSCDSTHSRDMSVIVSPRRDRGMSKIPAPVRQHTELF